MHYWYEEAVEYWHAIITQTILVVGQSTGQP